MSGPFRSLYTRRREFPSRVKTELEQRDRERLVSIVHQDKDSLDLAINELRDEVGVSKIAENLTDYSHESFILKSDSILVLSFLEHYMNSLKHRRDSRGRGISRTKYSNIMAKIEEVLVSEGLLWEIENNDGTLRFRQIESEAMEDIDKEIQALAEKDLWNDALKGYNTAFERYLNGDFDEQIPKKLYYSIEEVLKVICVDEEGWTENRELVHSDYLSMIKDNGVYDAHGATASELGSFIDALGTMVAKISDERKQRHVWHDRTYATFLIHQVGAYLYFLINRYNDYSS